MRTAVALIKRYPLSAFFVLAYALSWWVYPLIQVLPIVGFVGLFGPALAAVIVVAAAEGKTALRDLLSRIVRWRVGVRWYVVALGLPAVLALVTAGMHLLLGAPTPVELGQLSILEVILFVLVVGEEIGWRGYALPRLLATRSMLSASLILGVLWGAWHLPTFFIPGLPQHSIPFSAFMLLTIAYSVLFTWIYLHTAGSVLIATLFHGSINFCQGFFLGGIDPAREYWLLALVWWVAALVVVVSTGTIFLRRLQTLPRASEAYCGRSLALRVKGISLPSRASSCPFIPPLSRVRDGNTLKVLFTGTVVCRGAPHESGTFIYSTRACSFLSSPR